MVTTLRIIALMLAVASLLFTARFVHDRRQRVPGLLLSTGLILNIVGPIFHDRAIQIAFVSVSALLAVVSLTLFRRLPGARTD